MQAIERALLSCVVVVMSGCFNPRFACSTDVQCQSPELGSGRCEPNGACSFPNASCPSGSRYGDPPYGNGTCVPLDAALMLDARPCFGGPFLTVCLPSPPIAQLTLSTPIDTDGSGCAAIDNYCVLAGTSISIPVTMTARATGSKPLVLVASDWISVDGTLDVGSHQGVTKAGAGSNPAGMCDAATLPTTSGGGAGATFIGRGGDGGNGGGGGTGGLAVNPGGAPLSLRGGCPGQSGLSSDPAPGGRGGGAVYLIAGNTITINGLINAAGEGGGGGRNVNFGGGGGGAGGMIGFDAPTITNHGLVLASGGGGGEGSDNQVFGAPGADPDPTSTTAAAGGGTGGQGLGGNGGAGSARANVAGGRGAGSSQSGGGGGGGGAGLIKSATDLGASTSPQSSP
jgi:hypothetical protein